MTSNARYRPRKEIKMWLYRDKPEEEKLLDFVQYCKRTRQFARMLRNGIRLMWSLGEGNTEVLFELFPWLEERLKPPPSASDTGELQRQIAAAVQAGVQQAMLDLPTLPAVEIAAAPTKKPSVPKLEAKTAPLADANAIADNFLAFLQ